MQTHHDDDDAGDDRKRVEILRDGLADDIRRRAKRDKDRRETEDECDGGQDDAPRRARLDLIAVKLGKTDAGEIGEIRRHDRQHAWRNERKKSGDECAAKTDIEQGQSPPPAPVRSSSNSPQSHAPGI
jgi:hypothetical protein